MDFMTAFNASIDRRTSLTLLAGALIAGCQTSPAASPPPVTTPTSAAVPPAPQVEISTQGFQAWVEGARAEAMTRGISQKTIQAAFAQIQPIPRVVELDRRQPEFTQTFSRYLATAVSGRRVTDGRARLAEHRVLLADLERDYGVPGRFLISFWGMETNYGSYMGEYQVINALATLAYDGRRAAFFRTELFNALAILDGGHITLERMKGSWAGAMGNTQFMPSTFLRYAVDRDGDKHIDLWGSLPDALASAANYLRSLNWDGERTWGREVRMPGGFDVGLSSLDVDAKEQIKSLQEWSGLGLRRADGGALPTQDVAASLVLPQGVRGPAFLLYENYRAILKWNRSAFYAIAVGHLADRLIGAGGLSVPAIADPPFRREEIVALQEGLLRQAFLQGAADGVMGSGTRQAIRRYQLARGLPPDGYPDRMLIAALANP
jgi:membrane-bound lytic murein transglycosylase B